jgi:cytochrome c oxidase subunit IV
MKNPPILISVIGFFAALAGFSLFFWGFRALGFDWFTLLGDLPKIEHVGIWGWLAILLGIVWLLAAFGLWSLQSWARIFAMVVAGVSLFEAVIAFIQFPGTGYGFAMSVMPILILWYLNSSEVKAAFSETEPAATV